MKGMDISYLTLFYPYPKARNSPQAAEWTKALKAEREQLVRYGVFTKIKKSDIPDGTKIVDTKWVYIVKRKPDGGILKYKARKVGRGFSQEAGKSYDSNQTFAQMMRPETFKMLLAIALHLGWKVRQWDVVAAYLQAPLHHQVYVSDINEKGETGYWLLHKALYGLKQAGYEWFKTLQEILRKAGLNQCIGDEGTYVGSQTIIGTHVDDLLAIGPSEEALGKVERAIEDHVELDKKGQPAQMLGMEIKWGKDFVVLTQQHLIESTHQLHSISSSQSNKMSQSNKTSLPTNTEPFERTNNPEEPRCNKTKYQALIEGLLFIARMTRPDIAIHVNLLGRLAEDPSVTNHQAALKVLGYLYSTRSEGVTINRPLKLQLEAYADASYGGIEPRSQTGVILTLGQQPVGWYSRRQDIVCLSITEAEYVACCEGAKDLAWARQFLRGLQLPNTNPTCMLWTDSEGAQDLSKTTKFMRRSRHIKHRFHYLRQQVQQGLLTIHFIPGKENPADPLTKLLQMIAINNWKMIWIGTNGSNASRERLGGTKGIRAREGVKIYPEALLDHGGQGKMKLASNR